MATTTTVVKGAYWPSEDNNMFPPSSIDTSLFTHIFYGFVKLDAVTFKLVVSEAASSLMSDFETSLHQRNASIKALLSIGGVESDIFGKMVSSPLSRNAFIESTTEVARRHNFDGLDLRWFYPKDPTVMANMGILLGEWRAAINRQAFTSGTSRLLLTAGVYYSAQLMAGYAYPAASINANMDWVNVCSYDYYGSWDTSKTAAHAALYDPSPDIHSTRRGLSKWINAGVSVKKLVIGINLIGKTWNLVHPNSHGIGAPANGLGPHRGRQGRGIMDFEQVERFNRDNGATVVHDEQTGSTYSYVGTTWISYTDEISAKGIIKYAIDLGLLGYFVWTVNGDSTWKITRQCSTIWEKRVNELETAPCLVLYKAALDGDWDVVKRSLDPINGRIAANEPVTMFSENVIHVISSKGHGTEFLRELVNHPNLNQNALLETDSNGNTALLLAAMSGNRREVEILVGKNPALLTIPDSNGSFPVYVAAMYGHKETVDYLIAKTMERVDNNFDGPNGVYLLNLLITAGFYDMAKNLVTKLPTLAHGKDIHNTTLLQTLAKLPHNVWQHDEQGKLLQMIRFCWDSLTLAKTTAVSDFFWDPLLTATKLGIHEMVVEIINTCPYLVWFTDDDEHQRTIYHYAVIHRHEKIFNLIWNLGSNRYRIANMKGIDNTNILHLAAKLGGNTTSRVSGAALQMQLELQWYKEVEKLVQLSFQEEKDKDGLTPREVFTKEHKGLVKEGEEWMKTTASASTLVAALIVTVAFAAAFTVPGGNDSSTGVPIFLRKPAFIVFAISNAIALFSSSTSLMMFLGILNSRYSEIDFLHSLPRKLIIGLCTLFMSILCMLIAFSAALQLYLGQLSKLVIIPIVLGTCIPVIIFGFLQFPLLREILYSTYGASVFRHEVGKLDSTRNQPTPKQTHRPALTPTGSFGV